MASILPDNYRLGARAREFYSQVFEPAYESLHSAIDHTPLVIMQWGPRHRSREWSRRRSQIHATLEQLGHTAFLSEQLGVPIDAASKKGVEFLQSEATDLTVVIQPLYAVIGRVRHFVEFRVVDAKMLLFVEESAPDQHQYARALAELHTNYNNVETYRFPEDAAQPTLLDKILDHVRMMQMVKYRAILSAKNWGLGTEQYGLGTGQSSGAGRPFRHNLLELYREHRNEIDVLTHPAALFLLSFVHHADKLSAAKLARHAGLAQAELSKEIARLERAELLTQTEGMLLVSGMGHRLLDTIGLTAPTPRVSVTVSRPIMRPRTAAISAGAAGVALAGVILASVALLNGANIVQSRQPLEFTPVPTLSAPIQTATPPRILTLPSAPATPVPPKR